MGLIHHHGLNSVGFTGEQSDVTKVQLRNYKKLPKSTWEFTKHDGLIKKHVTSNHWCPTPSKHSELGSLKWMQNWWVGCKLLWARHLIPMNMISQNEMD